jgi:hypothetical protein
LFAVTGGRDLAKETFFHEVAESGFDAATGQFNPDAMLRYMDKNRFIGKEAVSSVTRTNAERFLRRAQVAKPFSNVSNTALNLRLAYGGISLAAGIGSVVAGEKLPPSAKYASHGSFVASRS